MTPRRTGSSTNASNKRKHSYYHYRNSFSNRYRNRNVIVHVTVTVNSKIKLLKQQFNLIDYNNINVDQHSILIVIAMRSISVIDKHNYNRIQVDFIN